MRFTKIRIANKQVELAWEERDGETKKTHALASPEPPTPAFVSALRGMNKHLPLLTDASETYLEPAEVRGITISSDKNDRRSLTMAAVRPVDVSNSPLNINTPAIIETEEVRDGSLFGDVAKIREVFEDFDALATHAQAFLNGERGEEEKQDRETDPGQTTLEEHIDAADRTEARKAFVAIMGEKPANVGSSNRMIMNRIVHVFDTVEYEDEGKKIAGLYRHALTDDEGAAVRYIWVHVDTTGEIPKLFYNVPAENFDIAAHTPTLEGFKMVAILREVWELPAPSRNGKKPQKDGELVGAGA